jgi:hypothetical protein
MDYLTRQRKRIFEGSGNHQFQPGQEISDKSEYPEGVSIGDAVGISTLCWIQLIRA